MGHEEISEVMVLMLKKTAFSIILNIFLVLRVSEGGWLLGPSVSGPALSSCVEE